MTFMRLFAVIMTMTFCCNYVIADENTQVEGYTTTDNLLNKKEPEDKKTTEPDKTDGIPEKVLGTIGKRMNEDTSCNVFTIIEVSCSYQKTIYIISSIFILIFIIAIIVVFRHKRWLTKLFCDIKHKK